MPKPRAFGGERRDALTQHLSPANRQDLDYELPVAAYRKATDRIQDRQDATRKMRQANRMTVPAHGPQQFDQAMRDYEAIQTYRHQVIDQRGSMTVKRENAVVKK